MDNLTPREKLVFERLKQGEPVDSDTIMALLRSKRLKLKQKNSTNSLTIMMKYLAAKICTDGWIISRVDGGPGVKPGGQRKGNKLVYSMDKRF